MKLLLLTLVVLVASFATMAFAEGDAIRGRFDAEAMGRFEVDDRDGPRDFEFDIEDVERFAWREDGDRRRDEVEIEGRRPGPGCDKCRHCCGRVELETCCHCPRGPCGPHGFPGKPGKPGSNGRPGHDGRRLTRTFGQAFNVGNQTIRAGRVDAAEEGLAAPLVVLPAGQFMKFERQGKHNNVVYGLAGDAIFVEKDGKFFLTAFLVPTQINVKTGTACAIYVNSALKLGAQYSYQFTVGRALTTLIDLKRGDKVQLFCYAPAGGSIVLNTLPKIPATAPQTPNANLILVSL